ncbi:MAG TPA: dTDP-4-dehydrorhamnose reductase [Clostridiales bacterium]|nr:dTDP-4-dehydrorhamnose reductase [Clostridiales bacterium]
MKIIVTGCKGQLGTALASLSGKYSSYNWMFLSRDDLDITDDDKLGEFFRKNDMSGSIVINCSAYTNVEKAEDEHEKAFLVNRDGAKNLARASSSHGFKLIHISTDFVFSGDKGTPYKEDDAPDPVSVYGKSKYAGELEVLNFEKNCLVIRTSWLYSATHNTFVKKIFSKLTSGKPFSVVLDEVGSPTYAPDLAEMLVAVAERIKDVNDFQTRIYHFCNKGGVARYYFAKKIAELTGSSTSIQPVLSDELNLKAQRPHNSSLDCERTAEKFGLKIRTWEDALKEAVNEIRSE